jgi:hypothetical protein
MSRSRTRTALFVAAAAAAVLALAAAGAVSADDDADPVVVEDVPTTTVEDVPSTTVAADDEAIETDAATGTDAEVPDPGPVAETSAAPTATASVATEAEYRNALTTMSGDGSGPHVIEVTANITLDDGTDPGYTGTQPLTINGNGHTIDAGGTSRILFTFTTAPLTINGLTLANGDAAGAGGAVFAVFSSVAVTDSTFTGNTAVFAGAIWAGSSLTITDSTLAGNTAGTRAGAAESLFVTITNSTLTGNVVSGPGAGAVWAVAVTLVHATVVDNSGGLALNLYTEAGLESFASVVASPVGGGSPNCSIAGSTTSNGYNYSDDASCGFTGSGDTENGADPELEALGDFGGPTPTRPPVVTSPLVDAIPVADCDASLPVDQRGEPRPADGNNDGTSGCDIGAVELQPKPPKPPTPPPSRPGAGAGPGFTVGPVAARPTFTG